MRERKSTIAVAQLLLLFPAALFMVSLIVRSLQHPDPQVESSG